jgi:hypothetical protein
MLVTLGPGRASSQAIEWKFFTYFAVNDLPTNLHRSFADDVTKATGGRLKLTVYAGGELPYKFSDVLRLVSTNQVQMGDLAVGLNTGELPGMNVFDLPFLCTSYDTFFKAIDAVGDTYEKTLKSKYGIGSLVQWTMPPQQIWLTQPITLRILRRSSGSLLNSASLTATICWDMCILSIDEDGGLAVAHVGLGAVWLFNRRGEPTLRVNAPQGAHTTNLAYGGADRKTLYITESETGTILSAPVEVAGRAMFSHRQAMS